VVVVVVVGLTVEVITTSYQQSQAKEHGEKRDGGKGGVGVHSNQLDRNALGLGLASSILERVYKNDTIL